MLIDWVTARVPLDVLSDEARAAAAQIGDRIQRICPRTGEVMWTTAAWDSVRSDSHQLAVRVGEDLWVQGSPARVMGDGCTVFGAGASAALDLMGCVRRMVAFVGGMLGTALPEPEHWIVSRIDVTGNLRLESLDAVRSALAILRDCEGGRYRVSQQAGDTVYWGGRSRMRRGKAYAKGPHLRHLMRQKTYSGYQYTARDIELADRLLRLELTLGREFLNRHNWRELSADDLESQWTEYFGRMIGEADMPTNNVDLQDKVISAAPTEGQGKAAYCTWVMIQQNGWQATRDMMNTRTWYRHLKILRAAGLGDADISRGQVVQLRRRVLDAELVRGWDEVAA